MKRILYLFILMLITIPLFQPGGGFASAQTTYHVAANGNDANPGTQAQPWLTPMRVEYAKLNPGDSVLFKRGDVFEGEIFDTLIGTWANPVVIGAYGSGPRPIFYGDLRGRTWTPTPGHPNIYQCYVGAGSDFQNGFKQYFNGAWTNSNGMHYRNAFPAEWGAFWPLMTAGSMGISTDDDTVFVHLYGDASGLGHDSLRCYRYAGVQIVTGSKGYYIRDLDLRDNYIGIDSWGDSARIRDIHTQMSITDAIVYQYGSNSICDSCRIDSTGDTGFYFVQALRCKLATTVITNTGLATVDGIPSGGIDRAGIGILDHHTAAQTGYGYNTIDSNTIYNALSGTLDFFYCIGDTFRYNVGHNCGGGAYPAGNDLVLSHNHFTMTPSGADGINCAQYRNGNITITYNTLDSVKDYGIQISENDSSGTFTVNNNTINMLIPARNFINYSVSGITSTNNYFYGTGDRFTSNGVDYNTLAAFQSGTGYEAGSVWYSSPTAPTGTFTITPDTLPANGGTVMLHWTSSGAASASLSYTTGTNDTVISVNLSDSLSVHVSATTTFELTLTAPLGSTVLTAHVVVGTASTEYSLAQNYPNPFNAGTTIGFALPNVEVVSLKVYDLLGREIATLVDGMQTSGVHLIQWTPKGIASGVYRYRLKAGSFSKTRRLVIVR